MNLTEREARALLNLHFYWNEKDNRFFRDWKLKGGNFQEIYFDRGVNQWTLYSYIETDDDDGFFKDYEHFDSIEELLKYFE